MSAAFFGLVLLGVTVGAFGTLIGAGGGFLLVPALLLIYPRENPETITSVSLAVVFFNALSGSAAYRRMKRIDFKSGIIFAIATLPGSLAGAVCTSAIPRRYFDLLLGLFIFLVAIVLVAWPEPDKTPHHVTKTHLMSRRLTDAEGNTYEYAFNPWIGIGLSLVVGFLSSLLGIGGGVIHVPALVRLLDFPVHLATATSHFVLSFSSGSATVWHIAHGALRPHHGLKRTIALTLGVLPGAQIGAMISAKIGGTKIMRMLGVGLGMAGARLVVLSFQ